LEYNESVLQLIIDFKKVYVSVRREVLCSILIEFGIPMNILRLIKMCLNEVRLANICLTYFILRMV